MSIIFLKFQLSPEQNNQIAKITCDDPLCLNRSGCFYQNGKGTLKPETKLAIRKGNISVLCNNYIAPHPKIGDIIDSEIANEIRQVMNPDIE